MLNQVQTGAQSVKDGLLVTARGGRGGEQIVSNLHGKYYELARAGNLFMAHAIVTAPVIYTTAAGTGGPLLYNGSTTKNAVILGVSVGISVVTAVAASLGITGNSDQAAPGTTTAIDSQKNLLVGGPASQMSAYRIGTPSAAGNFFLPFANLHTGALTVDNLGSVFVPIDGAIVVPYRSWISIAASATATTAVMQAGIIYAEVDA